MISKRPVSPKLWSAIRDSLCLQAIFVILGGLALDGGQLARYTFFVLFPYWIVALLIVLRRPYSPTPLDLAVVRFGYLALLLLIPSVSALVDPLFASTTLPPFRSDPASRRFDFRLSDV